MPAACEIAHQVPAVYLVRGCKIRAESIWNVLSPQRPQAPVCHRSGGREQYRTKQLCVPCVLHSGDRRSSCHFESKQGTEHPMCLAGICFLSAKPSLSSAFPCACLSWLHRCLCKLGGVFRSKLVLVLILIWRFPKSSRIFQNPLRRVDLNQKVSGSLLELDHHCLRVAVRAPLHCGRAPEITILTSNGLVWLIISEVSVCSCLALVLWALSYRKPLCWTHSQLPDVQWS